MQKEPAFEFNDERVNYFELFVLQTLKEKYSFKKSFKSTNVIRIVSFSACNISFHYYNGK